MNIIMPVAGKSSRFPNVRPKWMLTHPSGNLMLVEALRGIEAECITNIYVAVLKKHLDQHISADSIVHAFGALGVSSKVIVVALENETACQPETVAVAIEKCGIKGAVVIKDSDNYFRAAIKPINSVSYCSLQNMNHIRPDNKCYITIEKGYIDSLYEKQAVGSYISVGAYSFEKAEQYLEYCKRLKYSEACYMSHVINLMLKDGNEFMSNQACDYADWGTLEDWNRYKDTFATLFIDLDGVMFYNAGRYLTPQWGETSEIAENVEVIKRLYRSGRKQIILTSSRPESLRDLTVAQLSRAGIPYHHLLLGLQHAKRVIVNDYSYSNPYPSCSAINVSRDSRDLGQLLSAL